MQQTESHCLLKGQNIVMMSNKKEKEEEEGKKTQPGSYADTG